MSTRTYRRQAGFSAILIVFFALVVVVLISLIGWRLYGQNHEPPSITAKKSTSTSQQANAYAGWQANCSASGTCCSTKGGICFKYPAGWHKRDSSTLGPAVGEIISSPSKTIEVVYDPVVVGIGGSCPPHTCFFTAESMTPLRSPGVTNLTVVKGVWTNKYTGTINPEYSLDSNALLDYYHLKIGQAVDVGFFNVSFKSPYDGSTIEWLNVRSVPDNGFASSAAASAWLAKPEVVTAGKILTSVYLNKAN